MEKKLLNYSGIELKLKKSTNDGDGKRRVVVKISTNTPDRSNDIVDPKGVILDNYLKNPAVMYVHDYKSFPVASGENIQVNNDNIIATAAFPAEGELEDSDKVYKLIQLGLINAASIGFNPKEWVEHNDAGGYGYTFTKWELLEFSFVPVPCNQDAIIIMRSAGIGEEESKQLQEYLKAGAKKAEEKKEEKKVVKEEVPVVKEVVKEKPEEDKTVELQKTIDALTKEVAQLKEGRVLSDANRQLITECVDHMTKACDAMSGLLDMTIPDEGDGKSKKPEVIKDPIFSKALLLSIQKGLRKHDKDTGLTLRLINNLMRGEEKKISS